MYQPSFISFNCSRINSNATLQNKDPFDGIIESDVEESTLRKKPFIYDIDVTLSKISA